MRRVVVLAVLALLPAGVMWADDPPGYMQATKGRTVEIKGEWKKEGIFAAEEIELLPDSRRPKLRGGIEAVDTARQTLQMFGRTISIISSTQFLDVADSAIDFSILKPKGRAEVSCKVDSTGQWVARHIRVQGVKTSDKIKGTVSRTAYDGRSPDTLEIDGLPILVTEKTEVFRTLGGAKKGEEGNKPSDEDD